MTRTAKGGEIRCEAEDHTERRDFASVFRESEEETLAEGGKVEIKRVSGEIAFEDRQEKKCEGKGGGKTKES